MERSLNNLAQIPLLKVTLTLSPSGRDITINSDGFSDFRLSERKGSSGEFLLAHSPTGLRACRSSRRLHGCAGVKTRF